MLLKGWKHAHTHTTKQSRRRWSFGEHSHWRSLPGVWIDPPICCFFAKSASTPALTRLLGTLDWTVNQRSPSNLTLRCRIYWEELTCKEQINTQALHVCSALSRGRDDVAKTSVSLMMLGLICELNSSYGMRPKSNHNSINSSIVW